MRCVEPSTLNLGVSNPAENVLLYSVNISVFFCPEVGTMFMSLCPCSLFGVVSTQPLPYVRFHTKLSTVR